MHDFLTESRTCGIVFGYIIFSMKTIEKYILAVIGIMLIAFGAYVYASVHVTPVPDGWWGPNMLGTDDQVRANYDGNYDTMDCVKEAIPGD